MDHETSLGEKLLQYMQLNSLVNYGEIIPVSTVQAVIGIECPEVGTREEFERIALIELGAIDYVRNFLIAQQGRGMYMAKEKINYRILIPSENARKVESYMTCADKKLYKAGKLSENTPIISGQVAKTQDIRIMMKRDSIAEKLKHHRAMM